MKPWTDLFMWLRREHTSDKNEILNALTAIQNLFKTSGEADAQADDILINKKAYNGTTLITGAMPENGDINATLAAGESYTVPKGHHSGLGKVTATTLAEQTPGTGIASKMLSGITAWVKGIRITGSMAERAGTTVTASAVSQDDTYTYLTLPSDGHYDNTSKIKTENNNLKAEFGMRASSDLVVGTPQKITIDVSKIKTLYYEYVITRYTNNTGTTSIKSTNNLINETSNASAIGVGILNALFCKKVLTKSINVSNLQSLEVTLTATGGGGSKGIYGLNQVAARRPAKTVVQLFFFI